MILVRSPHWGRKVPARLIRQFEWQAGAFAPASSLRLHQAGGRYRFYRKTGGLIPAFPEGHRHCGIIKANACRSRTFDRPLRYPCHSAGDAGSEPTEGLIKAQSHHMRPVDDGGAVSERSVPRSDRPTPDRARIGHGRTTGWCGSQRTVFPAGVGENIQAFAGSVPFQAGEGCGTSIAVGPAPLAPGSGRTAAGRVASRFWPASGGTQDNRPQR